jgi:hypothetical protein
MGMISKARASRLSNGDATAIIQTRSGIAACRVERRQSFAGFARQILDALLRQFDPAEHVSGTPRQFWMRTPCADRTDVEYGRAEAFAGDVDGACIVAVEGKIECGLRTRQCFQR